MDHIPWYTGHVPRRLQRALSLPVRPSRLSNPGVLGYGGVPLPRHRAPAAPFPPAFTRKFGDPLVTQLFKYWPVRADLMEAVPDWSQVPSIPVLNREFIVPGLPSMLDNRSISYQPVDHPVPATATAGISSFAVNRGADERRQLACYGNLRLY
jgi:hypothetical protein